MPPGFSCTTTTWLPRALEIDDCEVAVPLAEQLGQHAAMAARRVLLEAEERCAQPARQLVGQLGELGGRLALDVRAVRRPRRLDPPRVEVPAQIGRG